MYLIIPVIKDCLQSIIHFNLHVCKCIVSAILIIRVVQWMSENGTSGLENRTKICPDFESSGYRMSGSLLYVRLSDV